MRYDSTKIKEYKKLTKENILKEISEEEIMRHYLGFDFEIGRMYNSPFRDDDSDQWYRRHTTLWEVRPLPECSPRRVIHHRRTHGS